MATPWYIGALGVDGGAGAATTLTPRVVPATDMYALLAAALQMSSLTWAGETVTPANTGVPAVGNAVNLATYLATATYGVRYTLQNCGTQPVAVYFGGPAGPSLILAAGGAANDGTGGVVSGNLSKSTAMADQRAYFSSTVADASRSVRCLIELF